MARIKLVDLYECVQSVLVALGLGKVSIKMYRCSGFRLLQRFFEQKGCVYYSKKLANEFADNMLKAYKNNLISESQHRSIRKVVVMLDEYKTTGTIKWRHLPQYYAPFLTCKNFENILSQYCLDMSSKKGRSSGVIRRHRNIVRQFLLYLEEHGYRSLSRLTRKIVSAYLPVIAKRRTGGISDVIDVLKPFLTFLHDNKHVNSELISALPRYPKKRQKHFVGFTREEANTLIGSVASDTHYGKRNIAMLTLAENTGLRAIDIANLKLNDIDWRNKSISIIQHKTRRPLILPFDNRVGDVLAEYILNARHESDSPFIFLSDRRPFRPISSSALITVLKKQMKLSGIRNNSSLPTGFHCFRRGIGTWLLEAELPLAMISEILGHADINSAKPYLSIDLENLRECAIGLEGIEIRTGVFQ